MKKSLVIILILFGAQNCFGIILKKTRKTAAAKVVEEIKQRNENPVNITENDIKIVDVIKTDKTELSSGIVIVSTSGAKYEITGKDSRTKGRTVGIMGIIAMLISGLIYFFKKKGKQK